MRYCYRSRSEPQTVLYACRDCEGPEPYEWEVYCEPGSPPTRDYPGDAATATIQNTDAVCPKCGASPPSEDVLLEWLDREAEAAYEDAMERRADARRDDG